MRFNMSQSVLDFFFSIFSNDFFRSFNKCVLLAKTTTDY